MMRSVDLLPGKSDSQLRNSAQTGFWIHWGTDRGVAAVGRHQVAFILHQAKEGHRSGRCAGRPEERH